MPDWLGAPRIIRRVTGLDAFWWIASVAVAILATFISRQFWDQLHGREESISTTVRNIVFITAAPIALALAVWRGLVAAGQAETAQRGLLNERYRQGAEMLGSNNLSVRLGGIYTLQRLAEDHPEQYHIQIMQLLCAFARHPTGNDNAEGRQTRVEAETDSDTEEKQHSSGPQLREDVQAVITAIGTRGERGIALEKREDFKLDLYGADLSYGRLSGANLAGADLSQANLRHANFFETHFPPPDLSKPIPLGPNQPQARPVLAGETITPDLSGMENRRANLSLSILCSADLSCAHLLGIDLSGAQLMNANLSKGNIIYANLRKAVLMNTDLPGAFVMDSDLSGARLAGANLAEAQLGAKLYGADFCGASLQGTDLSSALLSRADGEFRASGLTQVQIDQAKVNSDSPPSLRGIVEVGTGKPLVWREKPHGNGE